MALKIELDSETRIYRTIGNNVVSNQGHGIESLHVTNEFYEYDGKNTVERDAGSSKRIKHSASSRVESLAVKLYPIPPYRTRKEEREKEEKEKEKYFSLDCIAARYAYESTLYCVLDSHEVTGFVHLLLTYTDRSSIIFTGLTRVILVTRGYQWRIIEAGKKKGHLLGPLFDSRN